MEIELVDKSKMDVIDKTQYLTFRVGKDFYGVNIDSVKEVIEYDVSYKIPKVTKCIKGVVNLRGIVIPVIDMSYRLYEHESIITTDSSIIFIEVLNKSRIVLLGVLIDEVQSVKKDFIVCKETMPGFGSKIKNNYISKVIKVDEDFIIILDIENFLNINDLGHEINNISKGQ